MITPPIVGVPAFWWWPSGPSSRMCWPNSRSRRNSMNFGLRKMQMSSAAVPPKRRPHQPLPSSRRRPRPRRGRHRAPRPPAHAARALHEHRVARARAGPAAASRPLGGVGHRVRLALERAGHRRGPAGPTVTSSSTPACRGVRADPRGAVAAPAPSSSMSPSTATRRPGAVSARSSSAARIDIGLAL